METVTQTAPISKGRLWASRIMFGLVLLFLVFDGAFKFVTSPEVAEIYGKLGYSPDVGPTLGVIILLCTLLYAIPRTAVLGAILLTGYFGGAVATHFRVGEPLFTSILFPIYIGIFVWGALYLRDTRVSSLIPVRR